MRPRTVSSLRRARREEWLMRISFGGTSPFGMDYPIAKSSTARYGSRSGGDGGAQVTREFLQERVGLLLDHRLTEFTDLAEDGEVGLDVQARSPLGPGQGQTEVRPQSSPHPPTIRLG